MSGEKLSAGQSSPIPELTQEEMERAETLRTEIMERSRHGYMTGDVRLVVTPLMLLLARYALSLHQRVKELERTVQLQQGESAHDLKTIREAAEKLTSAERRAVEAEGREQALREALTAVVDDLIARADDTGQVAIGFGAWRKACTALQASADQRTNQGGRDGKEG
jgi:hypothetical protein